MIRNITAADFDSIYGYYMHPSINPYLLYEQMDAASFRPIFDDLLQRNIVHIFENDGIEAGTFKFIRQPYRNAHIAYLGGLAIHPSYTQQGYGKKMMAEIIELGKINNILRIELTVSVHNEKAIALYEKTGFVKEGVLRKFTHLKSENRFIDEQIMSYLY